MRFLSLFIVGLCLTNHASGRSLVSGREGAAACGLQVVYADPDLLDGRPLTGEGHVVLKPEGPLRWSGSVTHEFAPLRPEAPGYEVELHLIVEKDRSTWEVETPRLTVTTRLKSSKGQILAINEANSDQVLTPLMLSWLQRQENTRVVTKMLNPSLQTKLEAITEPDVKEALPDSFRALKVATLRGLIPRTEIYRVDTVCRLDL